VFEPTFAVRTSGSPSPSLVEAGKVPGGVTFVDNRDGTANPSATPAKGTPNSYPITIKAQNGIDADTTRGFTLRDSAYEEYGERVVGLA